MPILTKGIKKLFDIAFHYRKEHFFNRISKGKNVNIHPSFSFHGENPFAIQGGIKKLWIAEGVSCRRFCNIFMFPASSLIIHEKVFFNNYCSLNCLGIIEIGKGSIFGEAVKLYDHNHLHGHDVEGNLYVEREKFSIGSIKIGESCWIGSNVTILNNVEIGSNVIIGANNLIYKSIPSNSIVKAKIDFSIDVR